MDALEDGHYYNAAGETFISVVIALLSIVLGWKLLWSLFLSRV